MEATNSILDKILSTKQASDMEQFNPNDAVTALLKELTGKEEDVVRRRYGLNGNEEQTLEEIGKLYQVTRERIRQIEHAAVAKLKRSKNFTENVRSVEHIVTALLTSRGGIMEEESLLEQLLSYSGPGEVNRRAVVFLLTELLDERVEQVAPDADLRRAWKLKNSGIDLIRGTVRELVKVISMIGQPTELSKLFARFRETSFAKEHQERLDDELLIAALDLSQQSARNPYGEYGLINWGSIAPKRMNDKIFLVLKKNGKPLHFTEIANLINEANFDNRKAYPPTVHNELILNQEYVLVGRGIYALREWGYREGVVAEVIVDILSKAGKPLPREELVKEVLKQRLVKKNTIHLALTNRTLFKKLPSGEYSLSDSSAEPNAAAGQ